MNIDLFKCIKRTNQLDEYIIKNALDVSRHKNVQDVLKEYVFDFVVSYADYHENKLDVYYYLGIPSIDEKDYIEKTDTGYIFKLLLVSIEELGFSEYIQSVELVNNNFVVEMQKLIEHNEKYFSKVETAFDLQVDFEKDIIKKFKEGQMIVHYNY